MLKMLTESKALQLDFLVLNPDFSLSSLIISLVDIIVFTLQIRKLRLQIQVASSYPQPVRGSGEIGQVCLIQSSVPQS